MNAVDTNVLFYAHDSRDAQKQAQANRLIAGLTDGVLLWQVACEYLAASRKLAKFGYRYDDAWQDLADLRAVWECKLPDWSVLDRADAYGAAHGLSWWDALIVAASVEAGVTRLYSEDLGGRAPIDAVEFINPFTVS